MSCPRIGIPLDVDEQRSCYEIARPYVQAIADAGGLALPLAYGDRSTVGEYLSFLDGLLIAGGAFDIPPERYGEARRAGCGPTRPGRTEFEWEMVEGALAVGLPLLGVCGGMQLLNVVRGGALYQHLPEDLGVCHEQRPPKDVPSHEVRIVPGSLLARLVGEEPLPVNSTHHQAVSRAGTGVTSSGLSPDGVVEALELSGAPFALGVQWHPETAWRHEPRHLAIYRGLVDAARERR